MRRVNVRIVLAAVAIAAAASLPPVQLGAQTGRSFYASPTGSANGDGSVMRPLDLATALGSSSPVRPGDTLWLRGGRYVGSFISRLQGTASSPIIVRQYPNERVTLDGAGSTESTLTVNGGYTWYWGFEVMDSDTRRVTTTAGSHPADLERGDGLAVYGPGTKLINLVVHDAADGVGFWSPAENAEIYGMLTYNNGWVGPDRGHGHGIYVQNATGTKVIEDVISFNNFSTGMKAWAQSAEAVGVRFDGIISFNNGAPTFSGGLDREPNIFVGSTVNPLDRITVTRSVLYHQPNTDANFGGSLVLGYTAANRTATVTDNLVLGGRRAMNLQSWSNATVRDNEFYGALRGFAASDFPANTYHASRPSGVQTIVRRNRYESGRAHIAVYNWSSASSVAVNLGTAGFAVGDSFEIRDAQNYYGAPVVSGRFSGSTVTVPLSPRTVATPIGYGYTPAHTGPEFSVFVAVKTTDTLTAAPPAPPGNVRITR